MERRVHVWGPAALLLLSAVLGSLLSACTCVGENGVKVVHPVRTVIVVLMDVSDSTNTVPIRSRYMEALSHIIDSAVGGELLVADRICANSLAAASLPLRAQFPPREEDMTVLQHEDLMFPVREAALKAASRMAQLSGTSQKRERGTDILNSLRLAEKVFHAWPSARERRLVLLSDMVEQSERYDFAGAPLTPTRTAAIISAESKGGRLPSLEGVKAWVVGATSAQHGGVPPDRILAIERFWRAYFDAAGALLPVENYTPVLMNW